MQKKKRITLIILIIILAQFAPPLRLFQSMAVMSVYSKIHEKDSIMADKGFDISIPGGLKTSASDWYPFVMTFNDDADFKQFTDNQNLRLTIMYNFPAFSLKNGCSRLYDENSPYYNSFYGAYVVQDLSGKPYGFYYDNNSLKLDLKSVSKVPQFDFQNLVLGDFGLKPENMVFDWSITNSKTDISYLGIDGWTQTDANLTVNGSSHIKNGFVQSYLQYGSPSYSTENEFEPIQMKGRVYSRYFEEYKCSIFFYIITTDSDTLEKCDTEILSNSSIK
ncbi:hypothetical protein SDC9_136577 [bioreactor metagenome]|uniref:Uncharacterized protein n=1 Tax=bioreactor metagenome TaxID=1076179 RepID=A0A645DK78_9ZZZZ|nr:hypothetical protein [Candidatus Metalachnospira sp.]